MFKTIKEYAGVLIKDSGRYRQALSGNDRAANGDPLWLHLCNRNEVLEINADGPGVHCPWRWTSDLHACNVNANYARRLAQRAFTDWPIRFADKPEQAGSPDVSFIIAHQGTQRLDHVWWTVRSILAQQQVAVECIVVDQTNEPCFGTRLPPAVKNLHRPLPKDLDGWRKSWAFNQGAREAQGSTLVFHDGDIVCPAGYARAVIEGLREHGAASIQRFLFNLNQIATQQIFDSQQWPETMQPECVRQNWEGGTIAIRRDAFFGLGGYDEGFVGWGGEDNEFFDRCKHIGHLTFGHVPFVHLWHAPQSDKFAVNNPNTTIALKSRLQISVPERIDELKKRDFGNRQTPSLPKGYRDTARKVVGVRQDIP
ncbi:hypothetical protein FHS27_002096 [Rhodopirellula rubra]|uniref:Uncharacterized protein n=1 Tax=Aporhodopirellula rubra TaxID=980271 RepID=A0A7W5H4E1_9BACT|nr:galactosyltransferase-related protein [Aporhodopirellula rubra]MBB3206287.1 hypothetical protein [Aporhodopirellula rubra]